MRSPAARSVLVGWMFVCLSAMLAPVSLRAEEGGGSEAGKVLLGMRAGFAPVTQTVTEVPGIRTSTDVGSLVNFQAMYSLNHWLLVGLMLEWERHGMSEELSNTDLGHLDTVSVLPTVEIRPVKFGALVPYANMSFGVNVNSFGESSANAGTRISPSNNFAWRLGWGVDYMLTKQFALNTEMAYKRNDGHLTINDTTRINDANASSFGFLVGVKLLF